jgi:hypothetical protein
MSDNKPKIDLKARLGKKTVSSPTAGSVPPPMGIPKPAPAVMSRPGGSSIPAPPFGQPQQARIDPTNPYSSVASSSAPVQARPQEIRIEMGEEVREAQRKTRGRIMMLSLVTAIIGGVIGFAFGGGAERGKGAQSAITGAKELLKEVEDSNKQITDLADTIKNARTKLMQKGEYPEAEVSKLGAINIPFKSAGLSGRGIGRFKGEIVTALIDFASSVEAANDQKESLQVILSSKAIKDLVAEQKTPKVHWTATIQNTPGGPWVVLQGNPAPFAAADKWPDTLEFKEGTNTTKMKRYTSGDPTGTEAPFLPVDPGSQGAVCKSNVYGALVSQLMKMETVLRGDSTPGVDKTGLIESGQKLAEQLKKIGAQAPS